jgi:hypothetical protein
VILGHSWGMDHRTTAVINGPLREAKFHDRPGETPVTRRTESAILDFTRQKSQVRSLSRPPHKTRRSHQLSVSAPSLLETCYGLVGPRWGRGSVVPRLCPTVYRHFFVHARSTVKTGRQRTGGFPYRGQGSLARADEVERGIWGSPSPQVAPVLRFERTQLTTTMQRLAEHGHGGPGLPD